MKNTTDTPQRPAQPENSANEDQEPTRKQTLAKFLEIDVEELTGQDDDQSFELGSKEYLVLTDQEADERAADYIKDSLWAFNASFLAGYTQLPEEVFEAMQDKCENANDTFYTLIERAEGGIDGFIEDAISADGRGHFLNTYDGNENETEDGEYFIYRIN